MGLQSQIHWDSSPESIGVGILDPLGLQSWTYWGFNLGLCWVAVPDPFRLQSWTHFICNPSPNGVAIPAPLVFQPQTHQVATPDPFRLQSPTPHVCGPIPTCASPPSLCSPCSKTLEPSPASHPHDPHQFIQPHCGLRLPTGVDSPLSTIGVELLENLPARYGGGRTGGEGLNPVPRKGRGEEWGRIPLALSFGRENQRLGPAVPAGCPARTPLRAARSPQEIPGSVWPLEQLSLFLGTSKI